MDADDDRNRSPAARPGLTLFLKMIAPTRRTRILLVVSFLLDAAGILVITIAANLDKSRPIPLSISTVAVVLIAVGAVILAGLVLAGVRRQSRRRLPPG